MCVCVKEKRHSVYKLKETLAHKGINFKIIETKLLNDVVIFGVTSTYKTSYLADEKVLAQFSQ